MSYFDDVIEPKLFKEPKRVREQMEQVGLLRNIHNFSNILNRHTWSTKDGRELDPLTDMDAGHIENVMRLLQSEKFIDIHQRAHMFSYLMPDGMLPQGDMAQMAYEREMADAIEAAGFEPEDYFDEVIQKSELWRRLRIGKYLAERRMRNVKDMNKGILHL